MTHKKTELYRTNMYQDLFKSVMKKLQDGKAGSKSIWACAKKFRIKSLGYVTQLICVLQSIATFGVSFPTG